MDPIATMLTHMRNAIMAGHATCSVQHSNMKEKIAEVLKASRYIEGFKVEDKAGKKSIVIHLAYSPEGTPRMRSLKRVSSPGRRTYSPHDQLPYVLSGRGIAIVSTSRGIMTDKQARRDKVGGEIICNIW